tara:strand:+ start:2716 stop:3906 length:1191 start_codon:yes stop_codon:yes gene_type:complete
MYFNNKNILLCVTGGIAAYKSAEIIRLFKKDGADVRVVMTDSSKEFITPLTLQALSGNTIHDSLLDEKAESSMGHIELSKWADLIIIAPCTAESLSKLVHGRADDLMGSIILATESRVFIAPAMNVNMWNDESTKSNIISLKKRNYHIIEPGNGDLACGDTGTGRMEDPANIIKFIKQIFSDGLFKNISITITAGPTQEQIDPVRYITNNSSGKMGYALADAAIEEGAVVNLISGPVSITPNEKVNFISVNTAEEMLSHSLELMKQSDIFVSCAAVADFKPKKIHHKKIKKTIKGLNIEFENNVDILKIISKKYSDKYIVGFAAETENIELNAINKMKSKRLNMIIANDVSDKSIGFNSDENEVVIYTMSDSVKIKKNKKLVIARKIVEAISNNIK